MDFKYLGVPIFKCSPKSSSWGSLVDKLETKINSWGASWLNIVGKIVLIKSVLSSMPIYQSSILLAPRGVLAKIEALLRRILWKGGKQNENSLPLVSWGKVTQPILEGGLQIRDLRCQNLALGAKLLWNLVTGKLTWSKHALWKKYFSGPRLRSLDTTPRSAKGSPIFTLYKRDLALFSPELTWLPGNGRNIHIWVPLPLPLK